MVFEVLRAQNVRTNGLPLILHEVKKPIPHWLGASVGLEENDSKGTISRRHCTWSVSNLMRQTIENSCPNAACDTVKSLHCGTPAGDVTSVAVCSDGSYGISPGLMFSYPIKTDGKKWEIVQGVPVNEFSQGKIDATETELKEERAAVQELGLI